MKQWVFILFIFSSKLSFTQESSSIKFELNTSYKEKLANLYADAFRINYTKDTAINRYISLSPRVSFKHSSTIFDITRVILFKNGTFFCYTNNCLKDGSSAGNYKINNDTCTFTSSTKVFNKLKCNSVLKDNSFEFVELKDLKFLFKKEELISIK